MSYLVRFEHDGEVNVDDVATAEEAVARVRALHESGNPTGRVFREVAVRVETVVHVSIDDAPVPAPAVVETAPDVPASAQAPEEVAADEVVVDEAPAGEVATADEVAAAHEVAAADESPAEGDDTDTSLWDEVDDLPPVELPPLPAFFDEPDEPEVAEEQPVQAPPPPPRRAVTAVDFVAR